jgi:hypothetical protein
VYSRADVSPYLWVNGYLAQLGEREHERLLHLHSDLQPVVGEAVAYELLVLRVARRIRQ